MLTAAFETKSLAARIIEPYRLSDDPLDIWPVFCLPSLPLYTSRPRLYLSTCLPVYLSTCLPVYLSTCLPAYLSTCLPVYLSTCLPVYLSTCLPVYLSTCLPVYLSTCLPAYLPTCLPAYLPTCLPVYLSTCLPVYLPTCLLFPSPYSSIKNGVPCRMPFTITSIVFERSGLRLPGRKCFKLT